MTGCDSFFGSSCSVSPSASKQPTRSCSAAICSRERSIRCRTASLWVSTASATERSIRPGHAGLDSRELSYSWSRLGPTHLLQEPRIRRLRDDSERRRHGVPRLPEGQPFLEI